MKKPWIFLVALAFAGVAHAQSYKWIDKDGKTRYGDSPPPGVKATALKGPASAPPAAAPAAASKGKDAKKGPLTAAEREQEFRKRQLAGRKDQEKAEQERQAKADKAENCARAKEYQSILESGRVARTNAAGERYFMDESQIAQDLAKTRSTIAQVCN